MTVFHTGSGAGAEEPSGALPPVWGLPGAPGWQAVLSEHLCWEEHIKLDFRGVSDLYLAPQPRIPAQVHIREKLGNLIQQSVTASVSKDGWMSSRETSGQLSRLRENLDEVNWTVGAVNHTFSSDISFHRLKIQDMQVCLQAPARCQKVVQALTRQCHPDSDQQHHRGHQQSVGDARPHGGPAEEWDGHPQHHHRRPPPERLGALAGPEEHHHIRRWAEKHPYKKHICVCNVWHLGENTP